ncbi:MAG TPA: polysaccharide biosynthesis protein [Gemmataceae bacterium]|jgi:spore coat polysaccharide biosynthesis predicted glycosyltransferase SpsG|nr:polysaccharide biosynthesis protein [Gemmataceae bacterium]
MDRSPILFRCDANRQIGWESFYQCLTYAAALQRRRRPAYFLGQVTPFPLLSQIVRGGNDYIPAGHDVGTAEDCDETIRQIRKLGAAAVIVNAPGVQEEYLRELSSTGTTVVVIDTEAKMRFPNRLVINPLLGHPLSHYEWERGTQLLLGERYAIVRSVFRRQRALRTGDPQGSYRGIIAFGEDDFAGQSLVRAQEVLAGSRVDKLTVLVRSHHHQLEELRTLADKNKGRLEVLTEPSELGTRLPRAHFALTAGDGLSLEMACVGVPQMTITQNERHLPTAKKLDEDGAATYLGAADSVSATTLRDAVNYVLDDQLERAGMSRCAKLLVDGKGPDRIVNGLEILIHAPAEPARLRLVA